MPGFYLGEIRSFGFNFAPRGWAECNGQLLAISANNALFSLIGTIYGGDGRTSFALPDLRGRAALQNGTGPGLTPRPIGQRSGLEYTTLTVSNMPQHNHILDSRISNAVAQSTATVTVGKEGMGAGPTITAADSYLGNSQVAANNTYRTAKGTGELAADAVTVQTDVQIGGATGNTGASTSFNNMQPYLVINICISLTGTYPSRS